MSGGGGIALRAGVVVNGRSGRFAGTSALTDQQAAFVRNYVANGGNGSAAAEAAGYSRAGQEAWRLKQNPVIASAIDRELGDLARQKLAQQLAFANGRDLNAAIRTALELEGAIGTRRSDGKDEVNQRIEDMSQDELARFIRAFSAPEITPDPPGLTPSVTDVDPETGEITTG